MSAACFQCRAPAAFTVSDPVVSRVLPVCIGCAERLAVEMGLPALAEAVAHHKAATGAGVVRIRPGVERDVNGRWRAMCHITGPAPDDFQEYTAEWLEGPDAEARAEAHARELARGVRATIAANPNLRPVL